MYITPSPLISLSLCFFLCSSFHPIHCFSICTLHASFFICISLSLPLSLPSSISQSLPQQAQSYISGVDQIFQAHMDSTDGHKSWVFLKCPCRDLQIVEPVDEISLFHLQFHAKSLSLTFLCKVSPSASTGFPILSPCVFHPEPPQNVLILMHLPNCPCLSNVQSAWEVTPFQRKWHPTTPQESCEHLCGLIFSPYALLFHITNWLACRHDNNMSL